MFREQLKWATTSLVGTAKRLAGWDASGIAVEVTPASSAEVMAGTEDLKPITPSSLNGYRSLNDIVATVSGGLLNLNFGTQVEATFNVITTIAANCTVTVTETNGKLFILKFAVSGTIVMTMPSAFQFETGEIAIGRWNKSAKTLTLTATVADTEFEIVGAKRGSVWRCLSSKYE